MTLFRCPLDHKKYDNIQALEEHIESKHKSQLGDMSPAQYLFNQKYKKSHGTCIVCKRNTPWNEKARRYDRICSNRCREDYRDNFKKRMINSHGKIHLLNDPEQQKKMLASRKISGVYKSHSGYNHQYTGSYELKFLEFLDLMMGFKAEDVMSPAPHTFVYDVDGEEHFYIPDFFFINLNLLVEIKSHENKHYRERDKHLEKIKISSAEQAGFNTLTVPDNDFKVFVNYLMSMKKI